ncbi:MAG: HEAT repeat domain-containing protein [Terriglobia bacterium]|jgi:HEAT repeat protein
MKTLLSRFMTSALALISSVALAQIPQGTPAVQSPEQQAWGILEAGVKEKTADRRAHAVRALGLIRDNPQAIEMAEHALGDEKPEVRTAAARAMEQMNCTACISRLKDALADKEPAVVLAAAHALWSLKDPAAYDVYFAVLTGKRKAEAGLVAQGMDTLKDTKKMAEFGFEEGIGFIPFAGMGYTAVKALRKDDVSPVRAAAAAILVNDPDPQSEQALVKASSDKSWIVRAAALDAIGKRDNPQLLPGIVHALSDEKDVVRYSGAATVIRLSDDAQPTKSARPAQKTGVRSPKSGARRKTPK